MYSTSALVLAYIMWRIDFTVPPNFSANIFMRRQYFESLAEGMGGGVICETVSFVNGSSDQLQTQNQDSQYYSAPLLFRQDLSNS